MAGANTYCIRLSKDSTMASGVKTVCSLPGASYTVNSTAPGARMEVNGEVWFYQVAGVDASGNQSPWSSNQTFLAVEITTSLENESSSEIPVIYPNPFSDEINITQTTGSYQIVDLLGNVILSGTTPKVNTSALASGLYYLKTAKKVFKIVKN
ncbi:MAG: T9SS C-terminal target domain-containing protein [Bacteroidetes bacterium]|nr:MAG: T9SS C-terminal target domain-containing protein [Bacteroidota bacterium]